MKEFFKLYIDGRWKQIEKTGITRGQLSHYKHGNCAPRPKSLYKLCFVVSCFHNVPHGDLILEAIKSIKNQPLKNLLK